MSESKHVEFPSRFVDPIEPGEPKFALFSFVPGRNIKPDDKGFFGVAKIRGAYHTYAEASKRAEDIIKYVDSSSSIFTQKIGEPFPLVVKGYADDVDEVQIKEAVETSLRDNDRKKQLEEKKIMDEIRQREEALKRDVDPNEPTDPKEVYLEKRVKLAHLTHHIKTLRTQIEECLVKREKCRQELIDMNETDPSLEETYIDRYMNARRQANIPESTDKDGFMKYLCDDLVEKMI